MPKRGGRCPHAFLARGARGAVLPLALHWDSDEVKHLFCSVAKVSRDSVSLPFFAVIPALVEFDSSFENSQCLPRTCTRVIFLLTWTLSCEKK